MVTTAAAPGWKEPDITINGVPLTFGQAMALRVAASSFLMQMDELDALGGDETGHGIADGYRSRLSEVISIMQQSS